MKSLELLEPRSVEEAASLVAQHGDDARLIAGGTAVVLMLQNRLINPGYLVSLGRVGGLSYIKHEPGVGLRIGALTAINCLGVRAGSNVQSVLMVTKIVAVVALVVTGSASRSAGAVAPSPNGDRFPITALAASRL